jgi:hypothetical protein
MNNISSSDVLTQIIWVVSGCKFILVALTVQVYDAISNFQVRTIY